jgi:hypothetical protein
MLKNYFKKKSQVIAIASITRDTSYNFPHASQIACASFAVHRLAGKISRNCLKTPAKIQISGRQSKLQSVVKLRNHPVTQRQGPRVFPQIQQNFNYLTWRGTYKMWHNRDPCPTDCHIPSENTGSYSNSRLRKRPVIRQSILPGTPKSFRIATPIGKRIGPKPVRPQTAPNHRAPVNLTRLTATTVQTLLADHIQQRRRRMNPLQQRSIQLAGVYPARRAVRVPLDQTSPVLPASFKLSPQPGSNLPSRHRLLLTSARRTIPRSPTP